MALSSGLGVYNVAVKDKLLKYIPSRVVYAPPEDALVERTKQVSEEERKKGLHLPFISIWRVGDGLNMEMYNDALFRSGRTIEVNDGNRVALRALPVKLEYQFDLWANTQDVLDDLYREFIFCMLDDPDIDIELPENKYRFTLTYSSEENNTDISTFQQSQKLYRKTVRYTTEAKMFMRFEEKVPTSIGFEAEPKDDINNSEV